MLKKVIVLLGIGMLTTFGVALSADAVSASSLPDGSLWGDLSESDRYPSVWEDWQAEDFADNADVEVTLRPDQFDGVTLAVDSQGYDHSAAVWDETDRILLRVSVPTEGLYRFAVDFFPMDEDYLDYELSVSVNGEIPFQEADQIILYKSWNAGTAFSVDRYGNDFYAPQTLISRWTTQSFSDPMALFADPLAFFLEAGENTIVLQRKKGQFLIGDFRVSGQKDLPDYTTYLGSNTMASGNVLQTVEAETPFAKNASTVQAGVARDLGVTPFEVSILKLNILSGSSWNALRETVEYQVVVPAAGWYRLTFKVRQSEATNATVHRTLRINGEIPFAEAQAMPISYQTGWQNLTPADSSGTPYLFRFEAGTNLVSLSVDLSPYRNTYLTVQTILANVNRLSLDIKKLTGNQVDENRDWNIVDYLPTIVTDLLSMADALEAQAVYLHAMTGSGKASEAESDLKLCVRHLRLLAAKPDDIPKNITLLATSPTSVAALLGVVQGLLIHSPLDVDKFFIHTDVELPKPNGGFFAKIWLSIRRFFMSFFEKRYSQKAETGELEVWVNRSKAYVDLIQKLADETFTPTTGIPVKISVMSSEGKLILANSAKQNPDVALGIASWMPYDMGIRGALLDLTDFSSDPGFASTLSLFHPEALVPMVYDQGLYGIPDTENFYVLFYRTDILAALDLQVPQTWQDVTEMMPVLKRFGMNFAIPLSSATSLKAFDSTLPFLFQYGSTVYDPDAFGTALDDPASIAGLTMMTELYTIYSMDVTVSSFYNDFRLGTAPIGVGDFGMYVMLANAAPDIQGLWKIALMPGVDKGGGTIDRSAPGALTANVIFKNTEYKEESFDFLQWWASTATQVEFERLLLSTMGSSYMWNSANLEAFTAAGYDEDDVAVILGQWEWLRELPKVPGSYQVELEISNLWNRVVLDRDNLRVELNDAVIRADKEIKKKMGEFGYMDASGSILRPYVMTTRSLIESWQRGDEGE